jgi:hypothetical protein
VDGSSDLGLYGSARETAGGETTGARALEVALREKPFLARSADGGRSFRFVSWIVPWSDPDRAVMPAPVRVDSGNLVVALRRKSRTANWIDCYASSNNGASWTLLSRITETEYGNRFNGNPPALIRAADDCLCCAYGNRGKRQILARYSRDGGKTWTRELLLRGGFASENGFPDLGYVRLFRRRDGRLTAVYFWCSEERPQTHIEATVFAPRAGL